MELIRTDRVEFYEFQHSYLLDGKKSLIGVTQLMKKHNLSADYSGVSEDVLNKAAELGKQAHKAIEAYCDGVPAPETPLIKSFKKLGLNIIRTEYLVSDFDVTASSIDLVNEVGENEVAIIDMKRTSTVHKDALSWQLGIYKVLFERMNPTIKVVACYCLPIKKGNTDDIEKDTCGKLVEINPVSEERVNALIQAEKDGILYTEGKNTTDAAELVGYGRLITVKDALAQLASLEEQVNTYKGIVDSFKDEMYALMLLNNLDEIDSGGIAIKLKRPFERTSIDGAALKKKYPEIAEELTRTSEVKGSVTIKLT